MFISYTFIVYSIKVLKQAAKVVHFFANTYIGSPQNHLIVEKNCVYLIFLEP